MKPGDDCSGDLSELVDREAEAGRAGVPEHVAQSLFQQLMVALDYCHRLGIANRDVKVHGSFVSAALHSSAGLGSLPALRLVAEYSALKMCCMWVVPSAHHDPSPPGSA